MNEIHFLRPHFLYLFIPFAFLFWMLIRRIQHANIWDKICSNDLKPHVLIKQTKKNYLKFIFIPLTLSSLIIGLSGPSFNKIELPVFKDQTGFVIVLDLSENMNAEDVKPSRLKKALYKINDLLDMAKGKQAALVVFSEKPFVVTPLTDDISNIKAQFPALNTSIMPSAGHNTHLALVKATELLKRAGIHNGSILLITAELSSDEMEKSIPIIKNENISLSILGMGDIAKTPIPKLGGGFIKDKTGALITTGLSYKNLTRLAESVNGRFVQNTNDDSDIETFKGMFLNSRQDHLSDKNAFLSKWNDQGYLFVLLVLPFVAFLFRRGVLAGLIALLMMPEILSASILSDYFQTPDQKGQKYFQDENYELAKDAFINSDWKACAHYKLQEYGQASELFSKETIDGLYNCGTAKAKSGNLEEALKFYEKVLEMDPEHEDAKFNKQIIEDFLKQQQNNQNKNDKQDKNDDNNKSENSQSDDTSENSENKENQDDLNDNKEDKESEDRQDENESKDEPEEKDEEKNDEKVEEKSGKACEEEEKDDPSEDERMQEIDERFLKRVKDDPSELLRRKFLQQYRKQRS